MVDSTTAEDEETKVDFQTIIRRAEMIEMQLQMEARFKRNMAVFKANMPKVHDLFTDYEPKELRLEFSDEGYLHLINSQSGTPVYPENPEEFVQRQFEWFCASPSIAELTFKKDEVHTGSIYINES